MSLKKKKYLNYIILPDGSSIKKKSLKNQKSLEILKDNYNLSYISNLNQINIIDLNEKTSVSRFLKKFKLT